MPPYTRLVIRPFRLPAAVFLVAFGFWLGAQMDQKPAADESVAATMPANNKYGIPFPRKYTRVEDAVAAAVPYAVGSHRGTLFFMADGGRQFSKLKFTEASRLLAAERCACFLDTGKGMANLLYIPNPCEQYSRQYERCRRQQKPEIIIDTDQGNLRIGIHCTKIEDLLVNCPVR